MPPYSRRRSPLFLLLCGLLAGALLAACGKASEPAGAGADPAAAEAEWAWLQQARQHLEGQRRRLAALEAQAAAGGADPELARQTAALRAEVERLTAQLGMRLVAFINSRPPVDGRPLSAVQRAAVRMKSDEDILLARGYVHEGGDYLRAIEIYEAALAVDPGYQRLLEELVAARRLRYMTRDRFDQVREGMRGEEVRRLLGTPNVPNVRVSADREVEAGFYPQDGSGAAAAVWFRIEPAGGEHAARTVYEADFDAVQPPAPAPAAPAGSEPPLAPAPAP